MRSRVSEGRVVSAIRRIVMDFVKVERSVLLSTGITERGIGVPIALAADGRAGVIGLGTIGHEGRRISGVNGGGKPVNGFLNCGLRSFVSGPATWRHAFGFIEDFPRV